jgi:hypothetical protein
VAELKVSLHAQREPVAVKIAAVNRSRSFCMPVLELGEDGRAQQRIAFSRTSELVEESCLLKLYKNVKIVDEYSSQASEWAECKIKSVEKLKAEPAAARLTC